MPGQLTAKALADGQLPAAKVALYTVPAATIAYVTRIQLCNVSAGPITVNVYYKRAGGISRRLFPKDANMPAGDNLIDGANIRGSIILGPGDSIEGDASADASVDYYIAGAEEV